MTKGNFTNELKAPLSDEALNILIDCMFDGDEEARRMIIEHNLYLVKNEVDKVNDKPWSEEYQTLFTNGVIALINAVDSYARERSESFTRYAQYLCMLTVRFGLTGDDRELMLVDDENVEPVNSRTMAKLMFESPSDCYDDYERLCLENAVQDALNQLDSVDYKIISKKLGLDGETLNVSKIAKELGCADSTVNSHILNSYRSLRNILTPIIEEKNMPDISLDIILKLSSKTDKHLRKEIRNLSKGQIHYLLVGINCLPANYRTVMTYYLGLDGEEALSMDEIAQILGVTKANVQRIINKSFDELKKVIHNMIEINNCDETYFNFVEILRYSHPNYNKNNYRLLTSEQKEIFANILNQFPSQNIEMVNLYLGMGLVEPKKYSDVATAMGLRNSFVSYTIDATLKKISDIYAQYRMFRSANRDVSFEIIEFLRRYPTGVTKYVIKLLPREQVQTLLNLIDCLPFENMVVVKTYFGLYGDKVKSESEVADELSYSTTMISNLLNESYKELQSMMQTKQMK